VYGLGVAALGWRGRESAFGASFDGVFHAPAAFTLTVNLASMYKLGGRSFKLIDADGIADAHNVANWIVDVPGVSLDYRVSLDADNDLSIFFVPRGSVLIYR